MYQAHYFLCEKKKPVNAVEEKKMFWPLVDLAHLGLLVRIEEMLLLH